MGAKVVKVKKRKESFTRKTVTNIWQEIPCHENPYLADKCLCHGYDLLELIKKRSFVEVFHLLFVGELPAKEQTEVLETLMIALINPGPRHPATRAAMNTAVSRTNPAHLLPISLSVMSGKHLGGEEVMAAVRFFHNAIDLSPVEKAKELLKENKPPKQGDWHISPGFGSRFGGIDPIPRKVAAILHDLPGSGRAVKWGNDFAKLLAPHGLGWLSTGLAGAVFCDLGLPPRAGAGLFQLLCAPGLLAHGLEMANKPLTAMPFLDEEHFEIDDRAKAKQ